MSYQPIQLQDIRTQNTEKSWGSTDCPPDSLLQAINLPSPPSPYQFVPDSLTISPGIASYKFASIVKHKSAPFVWE